MQDLFTSQCFVIAREEEEVRRGVGGLGLAFVRGAQTDSVKRGVLKILL